LARRASARGPLCFVEHVSDPVLLEVLARIKEPTLLRGPRGTFLGLFELTWDGQPSAGAAAPLSDEERAALRNARDGEVVLMEFWKRLYLPYVV
jgi:hypothetical protein